MSTLVSVTWPIFKVTTEFESKSTSFSFRCVWPLGTNAEAGRLPWLVNSSSWFGGGMAVVSDGEERAGACSLRVDRNHISAIWLSTCLTWWAQEARKQGAIATFPRRTSRASLSYKTEQIYKLSLFLYVLFRGVDGGNRLRRYMGDLKCLETQTRDSNRSPAL